jgi:DNA-binding MarR family transcriptional regulator
MVESRMKNMERQHQSGRIPAPSTGRQIDGESLEHNRPLLEALMQLSLGLRRGGFELESASGLSGHELDLVALLSASGPTSVKILVADMRIPRSTMTAIVDRLEARGVVLRHPNPADRRSVVLEATAKASEALLHYRAGMRSFVDQIARVLTPEEREAFTNSIQKIADTL